MKISCDIIRDLLPLYAEDVTSKASNDMVDEHLRSCTGCREFLRDLRRPAEFSREIPVHSLNRVKKHIQKRRILTALLAVLILVSLYVNVQTVLDTYVYLTAEQAVEKVEAGEDGIFKIYFRSYVSGIGSTIRDEEPNNMGVVAHARLRKVLFSKARYSSTATTLDEEHSFFTYYGVDPEKTNVWYYSFRDGKPETLLWNAGAEHPAPDFSYVDRVHYRIAWYCAAAAVLSVIFGMLAWRKRQSRAGQWLRIGCLFFGCSCGAVLCTSGGQFMDYFNDVPSKIIDSFFPFLPMFLTGLCSFSLYDMKGWERLTEEEAEKFEERQRARNSRNLAALTLILLIFSLIMCLRTAAMACVYLTPEEAAVRMVEQEDGSVKTLESRLVAINSGFTVLDHKSDDAVGLLYMGRVKDVLPYRMGWKPLNPNGSISRMPKEFADTRPSYWYLNPKDGTAEVLLWDRGNEKPTGPVVERDNSPAYYTAVMGAAFLTFLLLTRFVPGQRKYLRWAALAFGSLFIGYVLASGGEFYKFQGFYHITPKFDGSLFAAVPLFLTGTSVFLLGDLKNK